MKRWSFLLALLMLWLGIVGPVWAAGTPEDEAALKWLRTQQQPDGGFTSGFAPGSDLGTTVEIVLAGVAAGQDPSAWRSAAGASPLDYLAAQVQAGAVKDAAGLSRVIFATVATGQDPKAFAGQNLVAALRATQEAKTGQFGDSLYAHAYALLALHAAGEPLPDSAVALLLTARPPEGGWAMLGGTAADSSDTNTTALALQALVAAGKRDPVPAALAYLHAVQNEDGGFPWQKPSPYGTDSDANSTAVVLQALNALGESPSAWSPKGKDPLAALKALWDKASGGYQWQAAVPGANVLASAQAVQAVEGLTLVQLPVVKAGRAPQPALSAAAVTPTPTPTPTPAPILPASGGTLALSWLWLVGAGLLGGGLLVRRQGQD